MFDNLNWWEIGLLLLLALLIFGDRLPQVISDGLRMLRNLRNMARNATSDLSRELGTDIQLEDLHPKAFIRKHLLSEEDEAALRKPLQGVYDDLRSDVSGVRDELREVADAADLKSAAKPTTVTGGASRSAVPTSPAADTSLSAGTSPAAVPPKPLDADAT
ncbi:preprotein translocase subunit TatB [Solwaraspora sp. WMMD792]|uniref:preprotein translocase subunit TatB n=1 Tax=Solwaraspora sp. WMMD792 TaxID=3016099 RepID=UPI0024164895|nr:preprotein translocase subunit TatB [Solwaraspora sp. WMMD792]MDG4773128.1 preprotein translocase subunit TatB [Solwaraspora sp. WMMD792]